MNESVVQAYMGKYYEKATNKDPKNIFDSKVFIISAFLGPITLFYHRCSLYGFVGLIIQCIIATIFPSKHLSYIFGAIYGIITYPIYNKVSRKRVEKLIKNNPNLSEEELIKLAAKKGKPNVGAVILYMIALTLLIVLIVITNAI